MQGIMELSELEVLEVSGAWTLREVSEAFLVGAGAGAIVGGIATGGGGALPGAAIGGVAGVVVYFL